MIATITLNAAIDKTYYVSEFHLNKVNRTSDVHSEPGGKGINVAKVLHSLERDVITSGFVGGYNGNKIVSDLNKLGIKTDFISTQEESRICLNIIDHNLGSQTEILENGPTISELEWLELCRKIHSLSKNCEFIVLSGSLPKGLSIDSYKELIGIIHHNNSKAVLDTSGKSLEIGLEGAPYMVKPNKQELQQMLKTKELNQNEMIEAIKMIEKKGVTLTIVSLGEAGAIVSYKGQILKVTPPKIEAVNPVGSGDAFVAGITAGLHLKKGIEESLILGTAAAAANALEVRAGMININKLEQLKKMIKIQKL